MSIKSPNLRTLLAMAFPMIVSQATETIMLFVDRLFFVVGRKGRICRCNEWWFVILCVCLIFFGEQQVIPMPWFPSMQGHGESIDVCRPQRRVFISVFSRIHSFLHSLFLLGISLLRQDILLHRWHWNLITFGY